MRSPTFNSVILGLSLATSVTAFLPHQASLASAGHQASSLIVLSAADITEVSSLENAASFMMDAFWLNSPQGLVVSGDAGANSQALTVEQLLDLEDKYGEIMGQRKLETRLLQATNDNALVGLVGIEVSLLDSNSGDTLSATQSEELLKNAVANLGPKERRQFARADAKKIAERLLPDHLAPVAVLSNLVVSPDARRQGIAKQLCSAVEAIALEEWGYDKLYLRVESGNEAAKTLYESKLGFSTEFTVEYGTGMRVEDGNFVEVSAEILVMSKSL